MLELDPGPTARLVQTDRPNLQRYGLVGAEPLQVARVEQGRQAPLGFAGQQLLPWRQILGAQILARQDAISNFLYDDTYILPVFCYFIHHFGSFQLFGSIFTFFLTFGKPISAPTG